MIGLFCDFYCRMVFSVYCDTCIIFNFKNLLQDIMLFPPNLTLEVESIHLKREKAAAGK